MNYRELAKIFTSSNINKVAQGDLSNIYDVISNFSTLSSCNTLQEVYDESYKLLCKYYPNEYVVKNIIANNILIGTHSMNTASMLSELRVGSNKADCVIINGSSTCYEIKTKFDSLKRLSDQLSSYVQAFDQTYVVAHELHLDAILQIHSENPTFGIIISNDRNSLSRKIIAPKNNSFNADVMFHTLRKEEYTDIIREVTGVQPDFPSTELFRECKKIFCNLEKEEANREFKRVLKKYRRNDDSFINKLPRSMKNLGISFNINKRDKINITSSLLENSLLNKEGNNVFSIYERKAK
ncbi:sce7726 family protein [Psychrobacter sp. 1176_08]|uniref:sce7726 family protein n=1 Tax=Psychrobacter TaxID=497 RepID=UPI003FCF26F3